MWAILAFGTIVALGGIAALSATGRTTALAFATLGIACVLPFVADEPVVRFHLAAAAALAVMRVTELVSSPRWQPPPLRRLAHVASVVDSRSLRSDPPALAWDRLLAGAVYAALAFLGVVLALLVAPDLDVAVLRLPVRWLGGVIATYAALEAGMHLVAAAYRFAGLRPPVLHDRPILARSVGEFWSRRWNRIAGSFLRRTCFAPLARRGHRVAALFAAFAASAVGHAYLFGVALSSAAWAAMMAAFFVIQFLAVVTERALRIGERSAAVARAWTLGVLLLSSPLFTEVSLRALAPLLH